MTLFDRIPDIKAPLRPGLCADLSDSGRGPVIAATLSLTAADLKSASLTLWMRSLVVVTTTRANQLVRTGQIAAQVIGRDEQWHNVQDSKGSLLRWLPIRFPYADLFPQAVEEPTYLYLRCRAYTSNALLLFEDEP